MRKTTKIVVLTLLIFLAVTTFSYADGKSSVPGYLLGILLGYGSGHFYFGDSAASIFLIGELSGTAAIVGGFAFYFASRLSLDYTGYAAAYIIIGVGALALEVFHIIEIIDIFHAANVARKAGRVTKNTLDLSITPTNFNVRYNF